MPAQSDGAARILVISASAVVLIAGLKAAASLILPFLMALFIALISLPLLDWLRSRRIPAAAAAALTILADIVVLVSLGLLVSGSVQGFTEAAPRYQERLQELAGASIGWLRRMGVEIADPAFGDLVNPGLALDLVTRTLRGAAAILSNVFLVFLTIVFILFEAAGLRSKLQIAFGRESGLGRFESVRGEILQYLGIKTVLSMLTGILVAVPLAILGVDFAVLWGLLAFLLNYIPNLGSALAAVPPILLTLVQFGVGRAVVVAVVFLAVNLVVGTFLEPHWMGQRLGLSTLVVFLSLVFWGWVWGPVGMLLSVPLTMIVKIMLGNSRDLQWLAILLGPNTNTKGVGPT